MATPPATTRRRDLPPELDDPLFGTALGPLGRAVAVAGVEEHSAEQLRHPERSLALAIPVRLDGGSLAVIPGYRVQHSSALGPCEGGVRHDPVVTLRECAALAIRLTLRRPALVKSVRDVARALEARGVCP